MELAFQPAFAFTLKKTRCSRQAGSEFERGQSSTVIRKTDRLTELVLSPLTVHFRCPCLTCTVKIAQVGISEVVYSQGYNMDSDVSQNIDFL